MLASHGIWAKMGGERRGVIPGMFSHSPFFFTSSFSDLFLMRFSWSLCHEISTTRPFGAL
jgi:hypothetical protein